MHRMNCNCRLSWASSSSSAIWHCHHCQHSGYTLLSPVRLEKTPWVQSLLPLVLHC